MNPWSLDYWQSGEYQAAREKLDDDARACYGINPARKSMFAALSAVPQREVRCCIVGQDPYPQEQFATGIAFSVPTSIEPKDFPPTLRTIFDEYVSDLGYPFPSTGNLDKWTSQGVLLWNAIPTCRSGQSLSHDWPGKEWEPLTREIISKLSTQGIVFAFLGAVARRFLPVVLETDNDVIITSHPSPRGSLNSRIPFRGSRLFSTINDKLIGRGIKPIDWRLDDVATQGSSDPQDLREPVVDRGRVLPNVNGATLPGLKEVKGPNHHEGNFEL